MKSNKITISHESNENPSSFNHAQGGPSSRDQMIATAAYYRAEKLGFPPNNDLADWFESEAEIGEHHGSSPN